MKKFFLLLVLVFTSILSFGQIMIPEDSIPRLISETAQKNDLENPNNLKVGQEVLLYFGEYVKMPVLVKVKYGDNLSKLLNYQIRTMTQLEQSFRNNNYEAMLHNRQKAVTTQPTIKEAKEDSLPVKDTGMPRSAKWGILGLIILALVVFYPVYKYLKKRR